MSVIDNCQFKTLSFRRNSANSKFKMFSSSSQPMLCVYKNASNKFISSVGFSTPHHWTTLCLSYLPTTATTLMITCLIFAGHAMFGKLSVYRCVRCVRTEADNSLSIQSYSVLVEGIMFVHCGGQQTNFAFFRNDMCRKAVCKEMFLL